MAWLDKLESRFRRFTIPQVTRYLAAFQAALWLLSWLMPGRAGQPGLIDAFVLYPDKVRQGEVWRLLTFIFLPPDGSILGLFAIMLFNLMGNALEAYWGTFRYNLFLLIAIVATITTAMLLPNGAPATNVFITTSVFLAFAFLYPEFVIQLFFILPVKVKWLALLTWIFYVRELVYGTWETRAYVLAAVSNFFLFFGVDVFRRMRSGKRQMESSFRRITGTTKPFHSCAVCGMTEKDDPEEDFRVCSKCNAGTFEYCTQHLRNHEHHVQQTAS